MRRLRWSAILLAGLAGAAGADDDWQPVADSQLAQVRGGFAGGDGLVIALGVERLVSINGQVVAQNRLDIADVARMSPAEAAQTQAALQHFQLVQNGSGNRAAGLDQATGLLLQNSLNDQLIRSQTTINTSVNSLLALKLMNIEATLRQALLQVTTPR